MTIRNARLTKIPAPRGASFDVLRMVTAMNQEITHLREDMRQMQQKPVITGDLDMGGHRITNVGYTRNNNDVPPRAELIDKALYDNGNGMHIARSELIASNGMRSKKRPVQGDEMATVQYVKDALVHHGASALFSFAPANVTGIVNGVNANVVLPAAVFCVIRSGPTGSFSVTGLAGGTNGRLVILLNATAQAMTVVDASTSGSTAANRILCLAGGANLVVRGPGVTSFLYDSTQARWIAWTSTF